MLEGLEDCKYLEIKNSESRATSLPWLSTFVTAHEYVIHDFRHSNVCFWIKLIELLKILITKASLADILWESHAHASIALFDYTHICHLSRIFDFWHFNKSFSIKLIELLQIMTTKASLPDILWEVHAKASSALFHCTQTCRLSRILWSCRF